MKTFEIQTPALKRAADEAIAVIDGRKNGTMEKDEAQDVLVGSNRLIQAVGQELKVRLAMPKLAAMEAKMIEAESASQRQIEAA